ncbi:WD domain, G-beta repeat [Novymonas esmeraldas]|uniref:WD domain, G-beta repeat n=1 Tax=Novymonas esmeraldas TaxID=1808958 RepID=A0AAW0F0Z2_9TRYP
MSHQASPVSGAQTDGGGGGGGGSAGAYVPTPLVDIETNDVTRSEMVQIIVAWLIEENFTTAAQVLREEATSQFRGEHYLRKTLRGLSRAVEESNWESAQRSLKKIQTKAATKSGLRPEGTSPAASLVRSLPFLLAQQQYMELVEEEKDQRSFTFFMRSIKPFERSISREHFQRLTYLLTCKTVAESSNVYPEYRGWTAELGRAQLLQHIRTQIGSVDYSNYCRHGNVCMPPPAALTRPLRTIFQQSFSYELVSRQHPDLLRRRQRATITSLSAPFEAQLPATEPFVSIDVSALVCSTFPTLAPGDARRCARLTACQPFLSHSAVVAATDTGAVLWIPTGPISSSDAATAAPHAPETHAADRAHLLYHHKRPIRDLRRIGTRLLCWGGAQALVLNVQPLLDGSGGGTAPTSDCVVCELTHAADVYAGCLFPCGTLAVTGLSEGTVCVWDLNVGVKLQEHVFSSYGVVSLVVNRTGTSYFAASKDGSIRVVDVATGVLTTSFVSPIAMEICSLALSPSSTYLLTSYRGGLMRMWDVLTGELLPYRFTGTENNTKARAPTSFGCSDAELFSGGEDGCVYFWSLRARDRAAKPALSVRTTDAPRSSNLYLSQAGVHSHLVHYAAQLPLHRSPITDVKVEGSYEVSCGEDGMIVICTTCATAHASLCLSSSPS